MKEVAIQLGPGRALTGVLSLPEGAPASPIGIVLPNAGVIHHVGPHRFTVKLARLLASQGWSVLRFDLSGIGDSGTPSEAKPYDEQAVADIRGAIDYLAAASGATSFVVAGICSGAKNGFNAALADPRIVGVWMMDEFYFPTRRTRLHFWKQRLRHERLVSAITRRARKVPQEVAALVERITKGGPEIERPDFGDRPDPVSFAAGLATLVARGTSLCFVYSGSYLADYSYRDQLAERFGAPARHENVTVFFDPSIDHTLTTVRSQRVVLEQIAAWCAGVRERRAGPKSASMPEGRLVAR